MPRPYGLTRIPSTGTLSADEMVQPLVADVQRAVNGELGTRPSSPADGPLLRSSYRLPEQRLDPWEPAPAHRESGAIPQYHDRLTFG